jgi:hypothetical protein
VAITATSMMGMEQEEKQLTPLYFLPREVYRVIGSYLPPFTIEERILSPEEHAQKNLPFKYEWIGTNTNPSLWERLLPATHAHGDTISYVDPATGQTDDIYSMDQKSRVIYRCVGPCDIEGKNFCIINQNLCGDKFISTDQPSLFSKAKKQKHFGGVTACFSDVDKKFHPNHEYFVDIDDDTKTLYEARDNGKIIAHRYQKETGMFEQELAQPPLSKTIQEQLHPINRPNFKWLALQFDHMQPDILFACSYSANVNSYAVLHRPTGYLERITSNTTPLSGFRAKKTNPFPLLDSKSPGRLRVFGKDVAIKLVTVHPTTMQPSALYIMGSVVHAAQQFCKNLETEKEDRCTVDGAQRIIDTLKSEVPNYYGLYGRLFYIWQSQMADGSYAVTKMHTWLEQQKKLLLKLWLSRTIIAD